MCVGEKSYYFHFCIVQYNKLYMLLNMFVFRWCHFLLTIYLMTFILSNMLEFKFPVYTYTFLPVIWSFNTLSNGKKNVKWAILYEMRYWVKMKCPRWNISDHKASLCMFQCVFLNHENISKQRIQTLHYRKFASKIK